MSGNQHEALRWLKQAEKDLSSARNSLVSGDYEWACFQSQQLRTRYRASKILAFGSYARHELNEGSDIDLLIVGEFTERFHKRIGAVLDLTELPIEPLCYTEAEFEQLVRAKNPFITAVLEEVVEL